MNKFILKKTTDGIYHLYFDTPSMEGFLKVGKAKKASVLKYDRYVVLSDGQGVEKTLYGIVNNRFFQVTIPEDAKVEVVDRVNEVCIFGKNECWYTMLPKHNKTWQKKELGKKRTIFLKCSETITYGYINWTYFLKSSYDRVVLSYFIKGEHVVLGTYLDVKECDAKLIATQDDGYSDVYTPYSPAPLKGKDGDRFSALKGVFIWSETKKKWFFYPNCRTLGKNAVYRVVENESGSVIELYKIVGEQLSLVVSSNCWEWIYDAEGLCINEMNYYIDEKTELVNFDTPKPTLLKQIKDFFKNLKKKQPK